MKEFMRLLRLFRHCRGWMALGLLLSLLTLVANVVLMTTAGWFIAAMGLAGVAGVTMNYFTPAAVIRACAIVRTTGRYGERLITHDATLRVLSQLRVWFYQRLERLAPAGLQDQRSGTLLSHLSSDIDILDNLYLRILLPLSVALLAGSGFLVWLWWQWPLLALAEGLLLLAGLLLLWWFARRSARAGRDEIEQASLLRTEAVDALQGLGELILYAADEHQAERLAVQGRRLGRSQLQVSRWAAAGQSAVTLCAWLALWIILVLLIPVVHQGGRPPAELAMFALFALASFEALSALPLAFQSIAPTLAAARRLFALVDREPPVPEPANAAPEAGRCEFIFEQVGFRYPNGRFLLHDISFSIPQGGSTAIIGPTGAGKSTLVQLMLRFQLPTEGVLWFSGDSIERWPGEALRRQLAVAEQESHLFIGSLLQNLLLANPQVSRRQIETACHTACLSEWLESLPDGLETEVGEAALQLSGGEARRLSIARALLKEAPVLILDEPTEGLDPPTRRLLMQRLRDCYQGRTLIVITHQLDQLEQVDQVVLMDRGRIEAVGRHTQLLADSPPYQALMALMPIMGA